MLLILLSWLGTSLSIIGALVLAFRVLAPRVAYLIMLPGALIWVVLAADDENWALAMQFLTFSAINVVGIVRWKAARP